MFNTKVRTGTSMFEDALHRTVHDNVTDVDINRDLDSLVIRIVFTIENTERTKTIRHSQFISNENIKRHRLEGIAFTANKIAKWIDEIPSYIPDEQMVKWIEVRGKYEM